MNIDIKDKKVLVIGLARSGLAAIKVLHKLGANIYLTEKKDLNELKEASLLNELGVKYLPQIDSTFEKDWDLVIKNPGVSPVSDIVKKLQERNIPIITEIELAYHVSKPQHYVAITGSNGKTTTTTVVYELLKKAFKDKAHVGGNIGTPLCEIVLDYNLMEESGHYISLEISNAQLVDIKDFRPEVSTIVNLSPDHIDFMGGLDNYYKSKVRVYENQKDNDLFILNADDEVLKEYVAKYPIHSSINTFSLDNTNTDSYIKDGYMYVSNEKVLPLDKIHVVGKHNRQNIIISIIAAKKLGISNEDIIDVIDNFKGVEHRIEFVKEVNGVKYYNDSKATNTDATVTALRAFDSNVILLVGGHDKGLDMTPVKNELKPVKEVIGFGEAGKRLATSLKEDAIVLNNLKEAVDKAYEIAKPNDIVLLSPTTSSFDQYSCFEERGQHFKDLVNKL